jgi:ribosomal protein S15P/S13E
MTSQRRRILKNVEKENKVRARWTVERVSFDEHRVREWVLGERAVWR